MTDRIVLAKALAASKVNVRGTGKLEHSEPRAAERADRTPNWNMWRHMPELPVWQCVALSLNIDPDRVRVVTWNWYGYPHLHEIDPDKERLAQWDWRGNPVFDEGREFDDRLHIARENLHRTLHCQRVGADSPLLSRVSLRLFAAWVREIGRDAPDELLAMADEQVAKTTARAGSGKCTDAATAKREAKKADRWADLKRFIDNVYQAAKRGDLNLESGNDRKALPFSHSALRAVFLERHPEHEIEQATFNDDLHKISAKVKPGPKRMDIKYLRTMLAKKDLG